MPLVIDNGMCGNGMASTKAFFPSYPSASFTNAWVLSSSTPQNITQKGIWMDAELWNDTNLWWS